MKNDSIDNLIDESYKNIKEFTDYNNFSDVEKEEIDVFFKEIQSILMNINSKKNKNYNVNLYETFKNLINGNKDGERNS